MEKVKRLFSQVFRNLVRGRNLQSASVEQAHLAMMMSVGLVSLVTDNAIDCCAAHPELAFLWCFLFHVSKVSQNQKNARDFFIFIFTDSAKLAWYLNDVCCKLLICNGLCCAAGRAAVSR